MRISIKCKLVIFMAFSVISFSYAQQTNAVKNINILYKSANQIFMAWSVSDMQSGSQWKISVTQGNETPVFQTITVDSLLLQNFKIYEKNIRAYKISGLQPMTLYKIYVVAEGNNENEAKSIEVKTTDYINLTQTITPAASTTLANSYRPLTGKKYLLSAWVKKLTDEYQYNNCGIQIIVYDGTTILDSKFFYPSGQIIDGWQRIQGTFYIPDFIPDEIDDVISIELVNNSNVNVFFDDIRIFPSDGNLKSFVYDYINKRLMAELDENNYATFYEYDNEGGLIRIKKETERGIFTIQETRSSSIKE